MIARGIVAFGVIALVSVALVGLDAKAQSLSASVDTVFAGARGTVAQYLFGMAVLLTPAAGFSVAFSLDWHRRAPLLAVRHGSLNRWLGRVLVRQLAVAAAYGPSLVLLTVTIRLALGPAAMSPPVSVAASLALVAAKVVLATFLFTSMATATIVIFPIDAIWVATVVALLSSGLLPVARSDLFPITAWSSRWTGSDAGPSILSLACAGVAVVLLVFVAVAIRKEVGHFNGRGRAIRS